MTLALLAGAAVALLVVLAAFPPRTPHWWRHHTRPIRKFLRPGRYRTW